MTMCIGNHEGTHDAPATGTGHRHRAPGTAQYPILYPIKSVRKYCNVYSTVRL